MNIRKAVVICILVGLGIASAGAVIAYYTDYFARASASNLPDVLNSIPSDYQFVFGVNVPKLVQSPAFSKLQQNRQTGNELASFIEKTGVDPARDISYLVAAGRPQLKERNEGLAIASGRFNRDTITAYIRSKSAPVELEYAGASVMMIPETNSGEAKNGIAFLNEHEIALGDLASLKGALDIRGKAGQSILASPAMAPLMEGINPDDMFWFAGNAAGLLARVPAGMPLGANASAIKSVVGALNITDSVTGKFTATAQDPESATKLADAIRGLLAFGQLTGHQNPDLKALLGGVAVSQTADQVSVNLTFSADLLQKIQQSQTRRLANP